MYSLGLFLVETTAASRRTLTAAAAGAAGAAGAGGGDDMTSKAVCEENVVVGVDEKRGGEEQPGQLDIWESIISKKKQEEASPPVPYVHPLVKRSSSLSEKSLEICTESLGSETGADGFSDTTSHHHHHHPLHQHHDEDYAPHSSFLQSYAEDVNVAKYKKSPPRPLPPPLPSLSHHIKSRRENGRLVLDAVSPSSQNWLHADRHGGRLVLSFVKDDHLDATDVDKMSTQMEENKREEKLEEGDAKSDDEEEKEAEQPPKPFSGGLVDVHRSAIPMKKLMRLANNNNPTWPTKFNEVVVGFDGDNEVEEVEDKKAATNPAKTAAAEARAKSLPPRPKVACLSPTPPAASAATSFNNAYEYSWRSKAAPTKAVLTSLAQQPPPHNGNNHNNNHNHNIIRLIASKSMRGNNGKNKPELLLLRGDNRYRADYFAPLLRGGGGCKEEPTTGRRSILIWEPYGIATS